jgi:hypothetical protein
LDWSKRSKTFGYQKRRGNPFRKWSKQP